MAYNEKKTARCSFCGRSEGDRDVLFLIPSPTGAYICNECVDVCNSIIDELAPKDTGAGTVDENTPLPTPEEIKKTYMDFYTGDIVRYSEENESGFLSAAAMAG